MAVIIPPSILMIVWGGVLTVSIGALMLAGIIPGLLIGLAQMATVHAYAKRRGYPTYPRATLREVFASALVSVPALMTPFIIVGGKVFGWFTATESACIAVLYAGALSLVRLPRDGPARACTTRCSTPASWPAIALFCVGTASRVRLAAGVLPDPEGAARQRGQPGAWGRRRPASSSPACSSWSAASSTRSRPSSSSARSCSRWRRPPGMDPVHFAIVGIVSLAFGLVTPPYGLCLMIACAVAKIRMVDALKDTMIMLVPMLLVLAAIIVWPSMSAVPAAAVSARHAVGRRRASLRAAFSAPVPRRGAPRSARLGGEPDAVATFTAGPCPLVHGTCACMHGAFA